VTGIGSLDRGHSILHQIARRAAIALKGKLDILGGHRLAVVELGALSQRELVVETIV
jgi:hypothetical protein